MQEKKMPLYPGERLKYLDMLRALSLIGMIVYHFGWDLALFGYLSFADVTSGAFVVLGRIVVSSFLFIVGFSLYLAHGSVLNWPRFVRRIVKIIMAAALVSLTTFLIFPDSFIYFGILHHIALASLLGLVFLRIALFINAALAGFVFLVPFYWPALSHPILIPLGLDVSPPFSFDYVPIFPWFCIVLIGICCARIMQFYKLFFLFEKDIKPRILSYSLQLLGRHSLLVYLLHQPVLLSGFYLFNIIYQDIS